MARAKAPRPTTVEVSYMDVRIEWLTTEQYDKDDEIGNKDTAGCSFAGGQWIKIRLEHPEWGVNHECALKEVLLHEIMHLCWHAASMSDHGRVADKEEWTISCLSPALLGVLRRNPEVAAYLLG